MNKLVDPHNFLWFVWDAPQLSKTAGESISDPDNRIFLSIASVWEIAIKVSIGKLTLAEPLEDFIVNQLSRSNIQLLPILLPHLHKVASLPFHHKDPFDRLIIAQSLVEKMPVVSR